MTAHDRLARIARQVLRERYASIEDQSDAMSAAIITDGLAEEWAVQDDDGFIFAKWHKSRESAEKHCATIVRNFWTIHKGVAGACMVEPHPVAVSRLVTPWADGGES